MKKSVLVCLGVCIVMLLCGCEGENFFQQGSPLGKTFRSYQVTVPLPSHTGNSVIHDSAVTLNIPLDGDTMVVSAQAAMGQDTITDIRLELFSKGPLDVDKYCLPLGPADEALTNERSFPSDGLFLHEWTYTTQSFPAWMHSTSVLSVVESDSQGVPRACEWHMLF